MKRLTLSSLLVLLVAACGSENTDLEYGQGTHDLRIKVGDDLRTYVVHVPGTVQPGTPAPVILAFHGLDQEADQMMLMSWLNPAAAEAGMIVVYPEALDGRWNSQSIWDYDFSALVVERMAEHIEVDRDRVFATGFSNGALFALALACQPGGLVKGVAAVGASVPLALACALQEPVPALLVLGDEDPQFPFRDPNAGLSGQYSATASVDWLKFQNRCGGEATVTDLPDSQADGTTVQRWTFPLCEASNAVEFYHVRGGGHTWPGSPLRMGLGNKSMDFSASETMVDFFRRSTGGGTQ